MNQKIGSVHIEQSGTIEFVFTQHRKVARNVLKEMKHVSIWFQKSNSQLVITQFRFQGLAKTNQRFQDSIFCTN